MPAACERGSAALRSRACVGGKGCALAFREADMINGEAKTIVSRRAALGKLGLLGLAFLVPATAAVDAAEASRRRRKAHEKKKKHDRKHDHKHGHRHHH
jgi:hypothetical protein